MTEPKSECINPNRIKKPGPYHNKKWLKQKYWEEELSLSEIAKLCGVVQCSITSAMVKFNIPRRSASVGRKIKKASAESNPNWKGGIRQTKDGVRIHCPNHPRADNMGYVKRSSLMVEKVLGRYLKENELVHHVNFNQLDDRHENFLVCEFGYHTGLHNKIRRRGLKIDFESLEGGRIWLSLTHSY